MHNDGDRLLRHIISWHCGARNAFPVNVKNRFLEFQFNSTRMCVYDRGNTRENVIRRCLSSWLVHTRYFPSVAPLHRVYRVNPLKTNSETCVEVARYYRKANRIVEILSYVVLTLHDIKIGKSTKMYSSYSSPVTFNSNGIGKKLIYHSTFTCEQNHD